MRILFFVLAITPFFLGVCTAVPTPGPDDDEETLLRIGSAFRDPEPPPSLNQTPTHQGEPEFFTLKTVNKKSPKIMQAPKGQKALRRLPPQPGLHRTGGVHGKVGRKGSRKKPSKAG